MAGVLQGKSPKCNPCKKFDLSLVLGVLVVSATSMTLTRLFGRRNYILTKKLQNFPENIDIFAKH